MWTKIMFVRLGTVLLVSLSFALTGHAAECLNCHSDTAFKIQHPKLHTYFLEFEESVHGLAGLDCSDCHGGDSSAREPQIAHVGVSEAVRYERIPKTCGTCHETEYEAFTTSSHFQIVERQGLAPNCVSCHGSMDVDVLFVSRVKNSCQLCHNADTDIRPDLPEKSDFVLSKMNTIKGFRAYVRTHCKNKEKVERLEQRYAGLGEMWHRFRLGEMEAEVSALLVDYRRAVMEAKKRRLHDSNE